MIPKEIRKALISFKKKRNVVITAGGTGGHIIPAMKVASELIKTGRKIIFITDNKFQNYKNLFKNEAFFSSKNFKIKKIPITSYKGYTNIFSFAKNLIFSFFITIYIFLKYRPKIVIGFGGYTAFMPLLVGMLFFKSIILHEQNIVFGKVNRMFLRVAKHILLSFPQIPKEYKKIRDKILISGLPLFLPKKSIKREVNYKIVHDLATKSEISILITGGGGGASFFATNIPPAIISLAKKYKEKQFTIYHQVKKGEIEQALKIYNDANLPNLTIEIKPFFENIPKLLSKIEFSIIRAGAASIIESAGSKVFSVIIPMPNSAHNHQMKNANFIAQNNAGVVLKEKNYTPQKLYMVLSKAIEEGLFYFPIINAAFDIFKQDAEKVFTGLVLEEELQHFKL